LSTADGNLVTFRSSPTNNTKPQTTAEVVIDMHYDNLAGTETLRKNFA
jgi:hypothetical protein